MQEGEGEEVLTIPHRKLKTQPENSSKKSVYDVANTSTSMIIINNKYTKNSRLCAKLPDHVDSNSLGKMDPGRHTRVSTIYASSGFHSSCNKSDCPRRFKPTFKFYLNFDDRQDPIGDRLYEARASVNPRRHRHCAPNVSKTIEKLPKIQSAPKKDFQKGNKCSFSEFHLYAWKQLYVRLHSRMCTRYRI